MKKKLLAVVSIALLLLPTVNAMATSDIFASTPSVAAGATTKSTSNLFTEMDDQFVEPENLGIPGEARYGTQYYAKNIWDMAAVDGKVLLSMGDYGTNTGAVPIYYYTNDSTARKECGYNSSRSSIGLSSEEIKRFFYVDDTLYATATDPLSTGDGSYYRFDSSTNKWTDYYVLPLSIHTYDMVEYDGEIYFSGLLGYNTSSRAEVTNCVQKMSKNQLGATNPTVTDVELYLADGTKVTSLFRVYDLFVFKGNLYAAHSTSARYTKSTSSGLFKYNKTNNRFEQVTDGLAPKGFMAVTRNITSTSSTSDGEVEIHYNFGNLTALDGALTVGIEKIYSEPTCGAKISTSDTFVAVCNGIFKSSDAITFEQVSLGTGYENYVTRDAFEKDGKYYFLASEKKGEDNFVTAVFETDGQFKTFRRVLYFNTPSFARSFVYNEGYLYVGLGGNGRIDNMGDSEGSKYAGTLYRMDLEELIPDDIEKTTEATTEEITTEEVTTEEGTTEEGTTEEGTTEEITTKEPTTEESTTEEPTTEESTEGTTEETTEEQPDVSGEKVLDSITVSNGSFSTGLKINQDYTIETTFSLSKLYQYRNIYESDTYMLRNEANRGLFARHGWYNSGVYKPAANEDVTVLQKKNVTYVNGKLALNATPQKLQSQTGLEFGKFEGKIKSFRVWDGVGTLVADYVPALDTNKKVCMYDKVSKTYIYYSGTCKGGNVIGDITTSSTPGSGDVQIPKVDEPDSIISDNSNKSVEYADALLIKGGTFDSGIVINQNYSIQIIGSLSSLSQNKNLYDSIPFRLRYETNNGLLAKYASNDGKVYEPLANEEFTVLQKENVTYINGNQIQKASLQATQDIQTLKFGDYKGTIIRFSIWDGSDRLVADYVPAVDENGVACLYDNVGKKYIYYSGTCENIHYSRVTNTILTMVLDNPIFR